MENLKGKQTLYCKREDVRRWALGKDIDCNGNPETCKHAVEIGKETYCGYCPPRCALHQIVKGQAGCMGCEYYTKDINTAKCLECLSNPSRTMYKGEHIY